MGLPDAYIEHFPHGARRLDQEKTHVGKIACQGIYVRRRLMGLHPEDFADPAGMKVF
jgi:hypothetical protein